MRKRGGTLALWIAALAATSGCRKAADHAAGPPPPVPVSVATAAAIDLPVQIRTIGNAEAEKWVTLRPQIAGKLVRALFNEGDEVKEGDLMLGLDKAPFEAALHEAEANLARNTALARDSEIAAERMQGAMASQAASTRELEQAQAAARAARGAAEASAAGVETARLNLAYCEIRAPISGKTGTLMVKPGNIVEENKTPLVEIRQIAPILVGFSVPEQRLNEVKEHQAQGALLVEASVPGKKEPERGTLTFIDNTVDPGTGTARMRATFANENRSLWPGLFVDVVLTTEVQKGVVVVPASAVQPSQRGMSVFVVKPDMTVEDRVVTVSRTQADKSVIAEGLKAGEVVVTDGQLRLVPGAKVEVKGAQGALEGGRDARPTRTGPAPP